MVGAELRAPDTVGLRARAPCSCQMAGTVLKRWVVGRYQDKGRYKDEDLGISYTHASVCVWGCVCGWVCA